VCLRNAFSLLGFVYVSGHGIDAHVIQQAFDASLDFFQQPVEVKLKYLKEKDHIQGYVKPGMEMLDRLKQEKGEPVRIHLRCSDTKPF
jgi:isopenicillin N synthase-like dioxygenase